MAQDQHYVPQTYLKWFFNPDELLFCLWKDTPKLPKKVRITGTGGVGYTPDFYVIKDLRQVDHFGLQNTNAIEDHFGRNQEQRYDGLINQLLQADFSIPMDVAEEIIQTLLSFKHRNPEFRETLRNKEKITEAFDKKIKETIANRSRLEADMKANGYTKSFEEFIAVLENRRDEVANNPDTAANIQNQGILYFMNGQSDIINTTTAWLLKSAWVLLKTSSEHPFITSDNPGFTIDNHGQPHNLDFSEESKFFFPISPLYMLAIGEADPRTVDQSSQKRIWQSNAENELVRLVNSSTLKISYKYILGSNEDTLRQAWQDSR